ncbi:MAG TPA: SMC family ATPase [Chloroflexota bacterium]|nr:SMC family ATPase [Chloroflexota bacterium]
MLPLRLRVRNFMSYGLDGGELDLRPIHLACLSGGNGHGKSTLIDAITWALWGKSRAAREDDLLRQGTTEMEVELEFAAGGAVYRVIRKRVQRKSASTAVLELAVNDGGTYRAITGATIAETERAIADLLHLSYDTFINSSLLLQGKADLFTVKKPAERKEVLMEILGLQRYEALAERARDREREYKLRSDALAARVQELDRFIAGLAGLEEQLALAEADLRTAQEQRAVQEALVAELEVRVRTMVSLEESLARLQRRLAEIEGEDARYQAQHAQAAARMARADELLAGEPGIRASLAHLHAARQENDRFGALMATLRTLERRASAVEHAIALEGARLKGEHERYLGDLADARTAAVALEQRRPALAQLQAEMLRLPEAQQARELLGAEERALFEQISKLEAINKALDGQRKELRKKIEGLRAAGAVCPLCNAPMDDEQRRRLLDQAMADGLRHKSDMEEHEQRIAALGRERAALARRIAEAEREIARIQHQYRQGGAVEQELRQLETTIARIPLMQAEEERVRTLLEIGAFALDERMMLQALQREMHDLGYDAAAHNTVQVCIRELAPAEAQRAALETVHEERRAAALQLDAAALRLGALGEERARLLQDQVPLLEATRTLPALRADLLAQQTILAEGRGREGALQQRLGGLRRQIEDGKAYSVERAQTVLDRDEATRQGWAHHELSAIFGKRGIQAMLIENALPELEQDANDLLARMTDNSTQVSFITRREGKAGNAIETLEIRIADSMGTRTYEMFSGGEAFRINLAIRMALSRLLARRAGAELSFLLIDEGFGSQDAQGRDRLVEAISAIADDFQKILVVTHIDELKDQFDVHIEISKGPGGSQITVSAA